MPVAPVIFVLAGVNGAGKSSVGGVRLRQAGMNYFNPDEAAQRIRRELACPTDEANARAWQEGKQRLESAIRNGESHALESTLGERTIPGLLSKAAAGGFEILVWFVGLSSPELHIARVRARVAAGGHDIPEALIRQRWDGSRRNIIALMPSLTELRVFDNSEERQSGAVPVPKLLLHWRRGTVVAPDISTLEATPEWARPIIARALQLH